MSAAPHALSPDREGRPLVIYHKDCTDGACAAWAAAHHLARAGLPEPVLLAAHPGITPEGAFAEEWAIVFVVDVCIPRADVERLGAWVLDHHKTNEPLLAGYERARFDMSRSGAGLAWDEVQAILWGLGYGVTQAARPWFVDYVEDRDLWRWALPDSRAINAALCMLKREPLAFSQISGPAYYEDFREEGATILRVQEEAINRAADSAIIVTELGQRFALVASPVFQSEVGAELCARNGCPAIVWYSRADAGAALAQVSLRSTDAMADVSEVATRWGGGGHRNAAGAVVPLGMWLAFVGRMVAAPVPVGQLPPRWRQRHCHADCYEHESGFWLRDREVVAPSLYRDLTALSEALEPR